MRGWHDVGIQLPSTAAGPEVYTTCPQCSASRRKKHVKCLSANIEKSVWCCGHCGWSGSLLHGEERMSVKPKVIRKPVYTFTSTMPAEAVAFFAGRSIPLDVVQEAGIICADAYMPQEEDFVPCLQFPFYKQGEVVNVKYRALKTKAFRMVSEAELIWYAQDSINTSAAVIIVEGEIDVLSLRVAGYGSVISVPNGAPSPKTKVYASKFEFLDQEVDPLAQVSQIILAVDNDEPGRVLRDELARRLGRERCFTVVWPEGCKDANDVLMQYGAAALAACIDDAQPWPIEDAVSVKDLTAEIRRLVETGLPKGLSTGWAALDEVFTIAPGQLTVITGIPSHGKSNFVDALAVNLMHLHGWRFGICSPENYPTALHAITLMEKWTNRTVRQPAMTEATKITAPIVEVALKEMHDALIFIAPPDAMSIPDLLVRATSLVKRRGIQGLILDPFNEFDHQRAKGQTEAEYISDTLGAIRRWARKWSVHVFVVAHPTKMPKDDLGNYPVPTPYDINGGAAWRNKSENCLTIWRDMTVTDGTVQVHIQKIRWRNLGTMPAMVELTFDRWTSRYSC